MTHSLLKNNHRVFEMKFLIVCQQLPLLLMVLKGQRIQNGHNFREPLGLPRGLQGNRSC